MKEYKEKYLRYKDQRDVVFVLGAGASHPDGVPLQKHILPMIMNREIAEISNSEIGNDVIDFIHDNFSCKPKKDLYPKLEAVFGFLDYFIIQNESLSSKYTLNKLIFIKEYLIKLIHFIVNLRTDKQSKAYKTFWENIDSINRNISIITLNYDTLLEQAFDFLFPHRGLLDYSVHLMNYDRFEGSEEMNFWINPREPVKVKNGFDPVSYKIIKVHGSLNWKYCNCCNQTLLTPWDRKIDLHRNKFLGYTFPDRKEYEYKCPIDGTDFETLILPPTFMKDLSHRVLGQLLSEASREIRAARKIVFIGYSLSSSDVHIKALFKKQLRSDQKVIVLNEKINSKLKNVYRELKSDMEFISCPFEDLVLDKSLFNYILD